MAIRNHQILGLPVPVPAEYELENEQALYRNGYINGRLMVNSGHSMTKESLEDLHRIYLKGFFDGYIAELDYELEQKIAKESQ